MVTDGGRGGALKRPHPAGIALTFYLPGETHEPYLTDAQVHT